MPWQSPGPEGLEVVERERVRPGTPLSLEASACVSNNHTAMRPRALWLDQRLKASCSSIAGSEITMAGMRFV